MKNKKNPTIKEVAQEAGVSFKTVSRVINGNPSVNPTMRAGVEKAMARLGYRPSQAARALRSKRSYTLALMCERPANLRAVEDRADQDDSPAYLTDFLLELIVGSQNGSRKAGYHMILELLDSVEGDHAAREAGRLLKDANPDGILLTPPLCDNASVLDFLEQAGIAYVRLMPGTMLERGHSALIDDFAAGREVGNTLLAAGHERMAFVAGLPDHIAAGERCRGFAQAAAAYPKASIHMVQGDFSYASGGRAARQLLAKEDRPTAIFAANDSMAIGLIDTARQMGVRIPDDLSVVGFDDTVAARLVSPKLTTIRQPTTQLAEQGADMLIAMIEASQPTNGRPLYLQYQYISRESAGTPPVAG